MTDNEETYASDIDWQDTALALQAEVTRLTIELTRQSPASTTAADAWEWGHRHSQGTTAHRNEKFAREAYKSGLARDHRTQIQSQGKNRIVKRRPAGPWVEVAAPEGDGGNE